ncbi:hypothetical protein KOI35_09890 [Actinoplanes bogorensis]|uniref:BIG2 domain-containing protein n=1 Tax=Paractinoplanes bogorensis TaxID=1610840 RepID=A0ABS5YK93_9ACTN|nr:hypothetical protein [Actinoplanes bogorensis]MBU2663818.1 hypothetical protein [Actinoplanes bogorensis]
MAVKSFLGRPVLGAALAMTLLLSGCTAVLGRVAVRVVMKIAQEVLVTAGADLVHQLISGADDRPTVMINYQDSSGRPATATYAIDDAKAIAVSQVDGRVEITGDGKQTVVTVQPPSTATIEIVGSDTQVAPTHRPPAPEPAVDLTAASKVLSGTWQGTYRCSQGLTGLKLVLYPTGDGTLLGTFNFYEVRSNRGVPSGRYAMAGAYSDSGFDLRGDYWVDQPSGYGMVDVAGAVPTSSKGHLTGRLAEPCKGYDLRKVSTKTSRPPV